MYETVCPYAGRGIKSNTQMAKGRKTPLKKSTIGRLIPLIYIQGVRLVLACQLMWHLLPFPQR